MLPSLSLSILFPNLTFLAGFMNVTLVPRSFENRYKRRNPYEIAERVAMLLDTLTADEIANQLLYI